MLKETLPRKHFEGENTFFYQTPFFAIAPPLLEYQRVICENAVTTGLRTLSQYETPLVFVERTSRQKQDWNRSNEHDLFYFLTRFLFHARQYPVEKLFQVREFC